VRSALSNNCDWLYKLFSLNMISAGEISPKYLVTVYYKEARDILTINAKVFGTMSSNLLYLKYYLALKHVRAVILCYKDSF
jgi:hypothetical protein